MKEKVFSRYQVYIIALLAILQFTVVLDFMVLSPLGAQLMKVLHLTTSQFGLAVSGLLSVRVYPEFWQQVLLINLTGRKCFCSFIQALLQEHSYAV